MRKIIKIEPTKTICPIRKRVAAYARVSVERDRTIHSLSAQISYYSELIQKHGEWKYAGVYADCGETGTDTKRNEFRRLLADCEDGKIDIILVKSISRFARNTVDLLETVRHLKEIGVEVRFEKENISSMTADGELMLTILASFAQEESRSISENIKWGVRRGFQKGKQSSTQIYGYRWDGKNFIIHPEEAEIVKLIFSDYLSGKSPSEISENLNKMGIKAMYSEKFWVSTILSMLENEKYTGKIIMQKTFVENHITKKKIKNKGELPMYVIENAHEPIIDIDTFNAAVEKLKSRKIAVEKTAFTSKIYCEVCGVNFQRATKRYKDNKTKVMVCANKKQGKQYSCNTNEIPENILEKVTAEVLGAENFDDDIFSKKIEKISVPERNKLVFHFKSGKTVIRSWESTASKDCWTTERRAEQAKRCRNREVSEETRERQRRATLRHYEQHPERRIADSERMKKFCRENPEWCKEQNERLMAHKAKRRAEKDGGV